MRISRITGITTLAFLILWPGGAPGSEASELQSALDEMSAIESQIASLLSEQSARDAEAKNVQRDLKIAEELSAAGDDLRKKGQRVLRQLERDAEREIGAIEQAANAGKLELADARRGIELSAPLLLDAARRAGPGDPAALGLALVQAKQQSLARSAVEKVLSLEESRDRRQDDAERIRDNQRRHAQFAGLKVGDLRRRHRELSERLGGLHAAVERAENDITSLSTKRESLNDLVARLHKAPKREQRQREIAALQASPSPLPRSSAMPPSESAVNSSTKATTDLAEVPDDDEQTVLPLGTRQGDGAPTMKLDIATSAGRENGDESRHVFWRAQGAAVRAIGAGVVMFSGAFAGYRHLLIVDVGGGWALVYGNLSSSSLREGDSVSLGQSVGEYQAGDGAHAEPFWVEARFNARTVPIQGLPGLGADWESRLFQEAR